MDLRCNNCGATIGPDSRFCSSCGAPVDRGQDTERKIATLVFADLVGSTDLASTLDPEELRRRLASFFEVARSTLNEYGGTVEKYIGDAVMAAFGVPRAHGDDPDRAIEASLVLVERVGALDDGLSVRIGVETGDVIAAPGQADLSVTGEAVNAAARLQQLAAPGEVLVGERSARAARRVRLSAATSIDAKGFAQPLQASRAIASAGPATTGAATPFVGREEDFDLLSVVYRRAARSRIPELVTITGEAGVGKTRLATELVESLRSEDPPPTVLVGRNPPYGRGIAFWALGEIIRDAAGTDADEDTDAVGLALTSRLADAGAEDADEIASVMTAVLSGTGVHEEGLRRGWRRMVGVLASRGPLVVGIDDAHWADDGFLDLVEEAVFHLGDVPLLIMCTARPELIERRPGFGRGARNVTSLELRPLGAEATTALAATLLPGAPASVAERVAAASGGNPFFAEEVARIVAAKTDGSDRLPDTVQAAIAARLDLLPAPEKAAVQRAAVLGNNFLEEALSDLLGAPSSELLSQLAAKSVVEERPALGPGRFGFRHQLIRDVAYATLPKVERARLHEAAADGIEGRAGKRMVELTELVSYHRTRAAELEPTPARTEAAWRASTDAAELVARRGATHRAQQLFERAADLAPEGPAKLAALRAAADLSIRRFRGDLGLPLLLREADLAEEIGDSTAAASALARAVELATRMGGVTGDVPEDEARRMQERGEELAGQADPVTRGRLVLNRAWLAWAYSTTGDMAEAAEEGLAIARESGDVGFLSAALDAATTIPWDEGRFEAAAALARERLELLEFVPEGEYALAVELGDALHMMISTLLQTSNFAEAATVARRARESDLKRGVVDTGWSRELMAAYYLGDWDRVLEMAEMVRAEWRGNLVSRSALSSDMAVPGAILGCRGDDSGAEEWFALGEAMISGMNPRASEGVRMLRADVLLHHGDFAEAARITDETSVRWSWWRAAYLSTRAESRVLAGHPDAAAAIDVADEAAGDNRYARATAQRARSLLEDDSDGLETALSGFEAIGCAFQAARTAWLLGGEHGREAATTFERLRVPPPV